MLSSFHILVLFFKSLTPWIQKIPESGSETLLLDTDIFSLSRIFVMRPDPDSTLPRLPIFFKGFDYGDFLIQEPGYIFTNGSVYFEVLTSAVLRRNRNLMAAMASPEKGIKTTENNMFLLPCLDFHKIFK